MSDGNCVVLGVNKPEYASILTEDAQKFLSLLHRCFEGRRQKLLDKRQERQLQLDKGVFPTFLPETAAIRDGIWQAAPPARGLQDRRVEITGPVDRKMVINGLNSSATQYMADLEDSTSPTWENVMDGQVNLRDATNRTITFDSGKKKYQLRSGKLPTLLVRPRGWHLDEFHFQVDGKPMSASLFDFGLYFFHNVRTLLAIGEGPYFYLPKMESHLEARLWNDVFNLSQDYLDFPRGTIRATVLIETILAAFEMEEIIFELREHSAGLNCGRWDYIFSFIKKFKNHPEYVLPDRANVTMTSPFMKSYVELLIKTCHKRGVHAMGGMAAQIPIKNDPEANKKSMEKVKDDKTREVLAGHDGTWVAHPDLITIAMEVFNHYMPQPNQIFNRREEVAITAENLITPGLPPTITKQGISHNVKAALLYMDSWLQGVGCVPINNLMEDAATAEIGRAQLWQWVHHGCSTETGEKIDGALIRKIVDEESKSLPQTKSLKLAKEKIIAMVEDEKFEDFLTIACYQDLIGNGSVAKL